jgi:hypothetical protein
MTMMMPTTMLLLLALVLVAPLNVSSFSSMSHVSFQLPPLAAVSNGKVPFFLNDKTDEEKVKLSDVCIDDAMDEVEEALKVAAEALGE